MALKQDVQGRLKEVTFSGTPLKEVCEPLGWTITNGDRLRGASERYTTCKLGLPSVSS